MKIENKEMLLYSMEKAIEEAEKAMEDEDNNRDDEVYYRVGTALHWIVDCFDRVSEVGIKVSDEDEKLRIALHAANNALKHKCELLKLHKAVGGTRFPMRFPMRFMKPFYVWESIENVHLRINEQKKAYENSLYGEKISNTFSIVNTIINKYFSMDK